MFTERLVCNFWTPLFVISKESDRLCSTVGEWINELCYLHMVNYRSAGAWKGLKDTLNQKSQAQKSTYWRIPFMGDSRKDKSNLQLCKADPWLPGARSGRDWLGQTRRNLLGWQNSSISWFWWYLDRWIHFLKLSELYIQKGVFFFVVNCTSIKLI